MGKTSNNFILSLVLIFIYEFIMLILELDGTSALKIIFTGFVWFSVGLAIYAFYKNYRKLKRNVPKFAFNILMVLIIWNLINIGRGMFSDRMSISTLFGNVNTALSFLLPFLIAFSINIVNLKRIKSNY